MADGIMSRSLKKVALGAVIVLVGWSAVAAQQTSPSQEPKASEVEESIFAPPTLDKTGKTGGGPNAVNLRLGLIHVGAAFQPRLSDFG